MLESIFTWLSTALVSSTMIAVAASFLWGILSIVLSPCHLASIPLIIGFIDKQGRISAKRAFFLSFLFACGILITIGIIGTITGLMGRMLGDIGGYGNYIVAVIFLVIGLHLLGIIPLPFLEKGTTPDFRRKGALAAFILGLLFGVALGPCTFAYMAPMLGVVFNIGADNIIFAVMLILAYATGHCSVIVLAGTFTELVQKYLDWNESSKGTVILRKVCGALVLAGGVYLLF